MVINKTKIIEYLNIPDARELFSEADLVREKFCGNKVHIRGIIEFSNYCEKDCAYCGLRKSNKGLFRYRLSENEIFNAAKTAAAFGYKTVVLQSGEDSYYTTRILCGIIKNIKNNLDCAITLSIGEKSYEEYERLRESGADRYLLRFETTDKKLYKRLKPDSSHENRLRCLKDLRKLGYQVGSGNMVGLPGQTNDILADDILFMEELKLDMIGIGPFIPHPDTPLAHSSQGTLDMALRIIALTRIVTRNAHMPATTAIGTIDPQGRQKALVSGANVIMPNITPTKYRKHYQIYPNKICVDDAPGDCRFCIESMLKSLKRDIAQGYGHSLR